MLEYARWKYILVAVVLLLALLFALPNFFGEDRALQVARKDHGAMTPDAEQALESVPPAAQYPLRQELHRRRAADGALRQRGRPAGGARCRQRAVQGHLHHRPDDRAAHAGAAAHARAATDAAGPRSARRPVPAVPGRRELRGRDRARWLRPGRAPRPGRGQHSGEGCDHRGGERRQAQRGARRAAAGGRRERGAQCARHAAAGAVAQCR